MVQDKFYGYEVKYISDGSSQSHDGSLQSYDGSSQSYDDGSSQSYEVWYYIGKSKEDFETKITSKFIKYPFYGVEDW